MSAVVSYFLYVFNVLLALFIIYTTAEINCLNRKSHPFSVDFNRTPFIKNSFSFLFLLIWFKMSYTKEEKKTQIRRSIFIECQQDINPLLELILIRYGTFIQHFEQIYGNYVNQSNRFLIFGYISTTFLF